MTVTLDGDLLLKPEERKAFYEKLVRDLDEALGTKSKEWDPDLHPREPAGSPEGGQFTSGGGDTGADAPSVTYALVADASEAYDRMAGGDGAQIPPSLLQDSLDHFITQPSVNLQRLQVEGERNVFSRHLRDYERGQMPQIPEDAEGFKRYEDFIASKGLKAEYEEVDPRELVATQAEIDSVKVAAITKYLNDHNGKLKDTGGVLVTSREHAIGDGHHRWAALASYATLHPDEGIKVRVLKVDTDIDTLLAVTHEFDRIEGIATESFSAGMTGAGSKEVKPHGLTDAHDYDKEWEYAAEEEAYRKEVLSRKKNPILKAVVGLLTALGIKTKEWDEELHPRGEGGLFVEAGGESDRLPKFKDWDPDLHPRGEGGLFTESGGGTNTADVVMVVEGTSKSTHDMITKAVRRAKDYIRPDDKPILVDTMLMKFNPRDLGITQSSNLVSHITLNAMVFESSIVDPVAVQAELGKSGWTSTGAPDHAVIHELGHALAGGSVAERREQGSWKILYGENQYIGERMAAKVSEYATRSPAEFVAETFAGLVHGQKYDTEVMQAYRTLGGREKTKKTKAWVEKFNEHHDELGRFASGDEGEAMPLSDIQRQQLDEDRRNGIPHFLSSDTWLHFASNNPYDAHMASLFESQVRLDSAIQNRVDEALERARSNNLETINVDSTRGALKWDMEMRIASAIMNDPSIIGWEENWAHARDQLVSNYENEKLGKGTDIEVLKQEFLDALPPNASDDLRHFIIGAADEHDLRMSLGWGYGDIVTALQEITPLTDDQRQSLAYNTTRQFVDAWAGSSSDSSELSLSMQNAAREVLGAGTNESFEKLSPADRVPNGTKEVAEALVKAIYADTQKFLKENDITELAVHRGLSFEPRSGGAHAVIDAMKSSGIEPTQERLWPPSQEYSRLSYYVGETSVSQNPLSSWSTDPEEALVFAGSPTVSTDSSSMVVHQIVPASAIFSVPATGLGCLGENEVVVISRGGKATVEAMALTAVGEK